MQGSDEQRTERTPLAPGDVVPIVISGGEWIVSHPASCTLRCHVTYLPAHADGAGGGSEVKRAIVACIEGAAREDPWLVQHSPRIEWAPEAPAAEIDRHEPVVAAVTDNRVAHEIDEYVEVSSLVDAAKALALSAMRFCGAAS